MRRLFVLGAILAASLWLAAGALAQPPWEGASTARLALTDAEAEIAIGDAAAARARIAEARCGHRRACSPGAAPTCGTARAALDDAEAAAARNRRRRVSPQRARRSGRRS